MGHTPGTYCKLLSEVRERFLLIAATAIHVIIITEYCAFVKDKHNMLCLFRGLFGSCE